MEQEQTLNPKESLELITDIINKTKENINQHSFICVNLCESVCIRG